MGNVTYRSNVGLKSRFSTNLSLYLRNDTRYGHSCYGMQIEQELSYRKQITRQLRNTIAYAGGIYRHKYYTVTLKSRLRVTQGHWKRKHWIDHTWLSSNRLSRVIWRYRDLEMLVRGHSKVIKSGTICKLRYGFLFAFHSNYNHIFSHFGDIHHQAMTWPWNLGLGSFKVIENGAVRQTMSFY